MDGNAIIQKNTAKRAIFNVRTQRGVDRMKTIRSAGDHFFLVRTDGFLDPVPLCSRDTDCLPRRSSNNVPNPPFSSFKLLRVTPWHWFTWHKTDPPPARVTSQSFTANGGSPC